MLKPKKSGAGFSLLEAVIAVSLVGLLVVAASKLVVLHGQVGKHLDISGETEDLRRYLRHAVDCSKTIRNQKLLCDAGDYVAIRNVVGTDILQRFPVRSPIGTGFELRARCQVADGYYALNFDYRRARDDKVLQDKLTKKLYEWDDLFHGLPLPCSCLVLPPGNIVESSVKGPSLVRTTFYHANVAVDPANTHNDGSAAAGLKPLPIQPPSTLANNKFDIGQDQFLDWITKMGVKKVEWIGYTHEYGVGLDKVQIDFKSDGASGSTVSADGDIYAAMGYLVIDNLRVVGDIPYGDIKMKAFNSFTGGQALGLGVPQWQDGTAFINPVSPIVPPTKTILNVALTKVRVTVKLWSDLYDTVQWRAVRVNLWAPKPVSLPLECPP